LKFSLTLFVIGGILKFKSSYKFLLPKLKFGIRYDSNLLRLEEIGKSYYSFPIILDYKIFIFDALI